MQSSHQALLKESYWQQDRNRTLWCTWPDFKHRGRTILISGVLGWSPCYNSFRHNRRRRLESTCDCARFNNLPEPRWCLTPPAGFSWLSKRPCVLQTCPGPRFEADPADVAKLLTRTCRADGSPRLLSWKYLSSIWPGFAAIHESLNNWKETKCRPQGRKFQYLQILWKREGRKSSVMGTLHQSVQREPTRSQRMVPQTEEWGY